ncbi:MAG TPA: hypothetical protein VL137_13855 [Polyangiaceae bacterium]|nr:hypothetical protein [Polyangiaceae bacterium]
MSVEHPKAPGTKVTDVKVTVECNEVVVAGGTRTTHWHIFHEHRWLAVREHPSARSERKSCGPGTVWEEAVHLIVPPDSLLKKVVVAPAPKQRPLFDYLRKEVRGVARRTHEYEFLVGWNGALLPKTKSPR